MRERATGGPAGEGLDLAEGPRDDRDRRGLLGQLAVFVARRWRALPPRGPLAALGELEQLFVLLRGHRIAGALGQAGGLEIRDARGVEQLIQGVTHGKPLPQEDRWRAMSSAK